MNETIELTAPIDAEAVDRLSKDLKNSARLLGQSEARYLVDQYYQIQDYRIRAAGQVRSQIGEPNLVLKWTLDNMAMLERQIQRALGAFASEYTVGNWLLSLTGIGPVITAGLLAHLDVRRSRTAGGFWKFAGLDPSSSWGKGEKRPWNADLKVLLWKAGESFVKVQNNKNDFYGKLFAGRKMLEWENNLRGGLISECERALSNKKYGTSTLAYKFYAGKISPTIIRKMIEQKEPVPPSMAATDHGDERPMLPPAHVHARARRYTEKIFLSHVHHVMYENYHGVCPPVPYIMAKEPTVHTHFIAPPNWPSKEFKGRSLRDLLVSDLTDDQDAEKRHATAQAERAE